MSAENERREVAALTLQRRQRLRSWGEKFLASLCRLRWNPDLRHRIGTHRFHTNTLTPADREEKRRVRSVATRTVERLRMMMIMERMKGGGEGEMSVGTAVSACECMCFTHRLTTFFSLFCCNNCGTSYAQLELPPQLRRTGFLDFPSPISLILMLLPVESCSGTAGHPPTTTITTTDNDSDADFHFCLCSFTRDPFLRPRDPATECLTDLTPSFSPSNYHLAPHLTLLYRCPGSCSSPCFLLLAASSVPTNNFTHA